MTVTRRRDRLVYFRISEEEFEQIQRACDLKGARSVSDLARAAVQEFISPAKTDSEVQVVEILKSLTAVVDEINRGVRQLVLKSHSSGNHTATTQAAAAAGAASGEPVQETAGDSADAK